MIVLETQEVVSECVCAICDTRAGVPETIVTRRAGTYGDFRPPVQPQGWTWFGMARLCVECSGRLGAWLRKEETGCEWCGRGAGARKAVVATSQSGMTAVLLLCVTCAPYERDSAQQK